MTTSSLFTSERMVFFLFLPLAIHWKNLVLLSPSCSHFSCDLLNQYNSSSSSILSISLCNCIFLCIKFMGSKHSSSSCSIDKSSSCISFLFFSKCPLSIETPTFKILFKSFQFGLNSVHSRNNIARLLPN